MNVKNNGKVFVCADLHFGHANIIKYEDRPYKDKEDMNEGLIRNWNSVVTDKDTVYVLGDVAFCSKTKATELIARLNGRKILIMGNHDRVKSPQYWLDVGFDFVSPYPIILGGCILRHEPSFDEFTSPNNGKLYELYGHVHGSPEYPNKTAAAACVSIERLGYKPALLEDVLTGSTYEKENTDA